MIRSPAEPGARSPEHVADDARERVLVERGREPDDGDQRGDERERELERERARVAEAVGGAEAVEGVEREPAAPVARSVASASSPSSADRA